MSWLPPKACAPTTSRHSALSKGSLALDTETVTFPAAPVVTKSKWLTTSVLASVSRMLSAGITSMNTPRRQP